MRAHVIALLITAVFASPVVAQAVRGTVHDASTGRPLTGVFVVLSDADGRMRLGALTDSLGRYFLYPSEAGTYSLRAELIGYETATRSSVPASPAVATEVNLALSMKAIRLQEIAVTRDRTCTDDRKEAREAAAVWEEARKALSVAAWLDRDADARFRIRIFEQQSDLRRKSSSYPVWDFDSISGRKTFQASPVDSLLDFGFVHFAENGPITYYGPDAQLLVSPRFIAEHCFSVERDDDHKGLIGLAFEPMQKGRVIDIRGALWLEEETGALKFIEYEYDRLPVRVRSEYAGGRVNVRQLPNGAFIVDSYRITMPMLVKDRRGSIRAAGLHERTGEVLDVDMGGRFMQLVPRYTVRGTVYDSLLGQPLKDARIVARGTPFTAVTDSLGAFTMHGVPPGLYVVDEALAVRGRPNLRSMTFQVDSADTQVTFGLPSRRTLLAEFCPRDRTLRSAARRLNLDADRLGVLRLHLLNQDGLPRTDSGYRFEIAFVHQLGPYESAVTVRARYDPDEQGIVTACGLPIGRPLQVMVDTGATTRSLTLVIPPAGFLRTGFVSN